VIGKLKTACQLAPSKKKGKLCFLYQDIYPIPSPKVEAALYALINTMKRPNAEYNRKEKEK
jgi:hypothetical protein